MAIVQGIQISSYQKDSIAYVVPIIGVCGNSTAEELARIYHANLEEHPYIDSLQRKYPGMVVVSEDSLNQAYDYAIEYSDSVLTPRQTFFRHTEYVSIVWGEIIADDAAIIYEQYSHNGVVQTLEKHFMYKDNQWTYATKAIH
jgi:hypothetical protein